MSIWIGMTDGLNENYGGKGAASHMPSTDILVHCVRKAFPDVRYNLAEIYSG